MIREVQTTFNGAKRTYALGRHTVVHGPSGSGKTTLVASLGLLMTGHGDDIVGKDTVAAPADLALAMAEGQDSIEIRVEVGDGTAEWTMERGRKPKTNVAPHPWCHPIRAIGEILSGSADNARAEMSSLLLTDAPVDVERLVPPQVYRAMGSPGKMTPDEITASRERLESGYKAIREQVKAKASAVESLERTLPTSESADGITALRSRLEAIRASNEALAERRGARKVRLGNIDRLTMEKDKLEAEANQLRQRHAQLKEAAAAPAPTDSTETSSRNMSAIVAEIEALEAKNRELSQKLAAARKEQEAVEDLVNREIAGAVRTVGDKRANLSAYLRVFSLVPEGASGCPICTAEGPKVGEMLKLRRAQIDEARKSIDRAWETVNLDAQKSANTKYAEKLSSAEAATEAICAQIEEVIVLSGKLKAEAAELSRAAQQDQAKRNPPLGDELAQVVASYNAVAARYATVTAELAAEAAALGPEVPEGENEQNVRELLSIAEATTRDWERARALRSELITLQQQESTLALAINEVTTLIDRVYRERIAAAEDGVSRWLPEGWKMRLVLTSPSGSRVFRLGLISPNGVFSTNPNGGHRSALLIALACFLVDQRRIPRGPDGSLDPVIMLSEERNFDSEWLGEVMRATEDAPVQIILANLYPPKGYRGQGWSVVDLAEMTPEPVVDGAAVVAATKKRGGRKPRAEKLDAGAAAQVAAHAGAPGAPASPEAQAGLPPLNDPPTTEPPVLPMPAPSLVGVSALPAELSALLNGSQA